MSPVAGNMGFTRRSQWDAMTAVHLGKKKLLYPDRLVHRWTGRAVQVWKSSAPADAASPKTLSTYRQYGSIRVCASAGTDRNSDRQERWQRYVSGRTGWILRCRIPGDRGPVLSASLRLPMPKTSNVRDLSTVRSVADELSYHRRRVRPRSCGTLKASDYNPRSKAKILQPQRVGRTAR